MTIRREIRKKLWKIGFDVCRFEPHSHPLARRRRLFDSLGVDVVLDVGANTGQYAQELRDDFDYTGRIVSFEPLQAEFEQLSTAASQFPNWDVVRCALGDAEGQQQINVAGNSYSSSLLDMLPSHERAAPESAYTGQQLIQVRTLDSIIDEICPDEENIFLKIDTQGYESKVLAGAERALARIATIRLEMSLVPLYEGELLIDDMVRLLRELGYNPIAIEPGFANPSTGRLLQADGVFGRA